MSRWWLGGVCLLFAAFAGWAGPSPKDDDGLETIELPERLPPRVPAPWAPSELAWSLALQGLYGAASAGENPVLAGFLSVLASDVEQRRSDDPPAHRFEGDATTLIALLRWQHGTPDFERLERRQRSGRPG